MWGWEFQDFLEENITLKNNTELFVVDRPHSFSKTYYTSLLGVRTYVFQAKILFLRKLENVSDFF